VAPLPSQSACGARTGKVLIVTEKDPSDICITLLHGTWGRGLFPDCRPPEGVKRKPFWFEVGSLFRTRLESTLEYLKISYKIKTHEWSGANSILERARVAEDLAARLRDSMAEHPDTKQVVIAHSHGGNVVRLALNQLPDARSVSVVTLATPFVEVTRLHPSGYKERGSMAVGIMLGLSMPVVLQLVQISVAYGVSMVTLLLNALLVGVVGSYLHLQLDRGLRAIYEKADKLIEATKGGMDWRSIGTPTLVIRAVDDEASLGLTAGTIGNRLSLVLVRLIMRIKHMMASWKNTIAYMLALALALFLLIEVELIPVFRFTNDITDNWSIFLFYLLLYIPWLISLVLVLFAGFFKSVYGRELFLASFLCEINSHSAPDMGKSASVVTLSVASGRESGLRHSIYDHEDCVPHIVAFLKARLEAIEQKAGHGDH
jgi:pimeloyl-ACP methyl ester carboxylesterase